jgi:hypothetical protein
MNIYSMYMLTPGVLWDDGEFTPAATAEEAEDRADREGYGLARAALMGFDQEGDRWEVLMTGTHHHIARKTAKMFGLDVLWNGEFAVKFDRAYGCEARMYRDERNERVIAFGGLLSGMMAAKEGSPTGWKQAFELCRRLGLSIKPIYGYDGPLTEEV